MNLFVCGWNSEEPGRARALDALRRMHDAYSLLDPRTLTQWGSGGIFAAWMHGSAAALGPRRYVHERGHRLVLYDGTAVDPRGRIAGHDARSLDAYWDELSDHLEGRFVAIRLDTEARTLDLVNDPYGVYQTFVHYDEGTWWISNSARLLAGVARTAALDLDAVAMQLGVRALSGESTLVHGVSVVPAAQRRTWRPGHVPRSDTYAPTADFAATPQRPVGPRDAAAVADAMGSMLSVLADAFPPLECPITAGHDSRVLTGLMIARDLPGDFFTAGEASSADARIGTAIAQAFALPHRKTGDARENLVEQWDVLARRVIQQHDGTVTLMHARNALRTRARPDRLPVQLYGAAGEIARGKRLRPAFVRRRPDLAAAIERTAAPLGATRGLLSEEARQAVRRQIGDICRNLHAQGFAPVDVPDAYGLTESWRRWGGAQARQGNEWKDVFLPFLTRAFVGAAFAAPARDRLMERLPFEVLRHLSPELHAMPFEHPWPPQRFSALLARQALTFPDKVRRSLLARIQPPRRLDPGRQSERLFVFRHQLPLWRERFLDRSASSLWQVVDRPRFEFLTSDRATAADHVKSFEHLFAVITAFEFEEDLETWRRQLRATGDAIVPGAPVVARS